MTDAPYAPYVPWQPDDPETVLADWVRLGWVAPPPYGHPLLDHANPMVRMLARWPVRGAFAEAERLAREDAAEDVE
jgi:hypothetical protein